MARTLTRGALPTGERRCTRYTGSNHRTGIVVPSRPTLRRTVRTATTASPRRPSPRGEGWRGQVVVAAPGELEAALDDLDPSDLSQQGLVLERNLDDVTTYSVGQVRLDGLTVTYCGTQRATPDNAGATVYGGSDLL